MVDTTLKGTKVVPSAASNSTEPAQGKGQMIEAVCIVMAVLSLIVGVLGAYAFSDVPRIGYSGLVLGKERSGFLTTWWLGGGVGSAVVWWALSGIGTAIRWLELAGGRMSPMSSELANSPVQTRETEQSQVTVATEGKSSVGTQAKASDSALTAADANPAKGTRGDIAAWIVGILVLVLAVLSFNGVLG